MTIDWAHFTPWASLSGGILLGLAAAVFILFNGRILGISGILGGLLSPRMGDIGWRLSFLLGMAAAPLAFAWIAPTGFLAAPRIDASYALIVAAGLLVGLLWLACCSAWACCCPVCRILARCWAFWICSAPGTRPWPW